MNKAPTLADALARIATLELKVAELESLEVNQKGRADQEARRITIESANREAELKAKKAAEADDHLRRHLVVDPLVRAYVSGGPGGHFGCRLSYPREPRLDREPRFDLASPGSTTINGVFLAQSCTRRRSDWMQIVAASGGVIERAIATGHIQVFEYDVETVLGDDKLRSCWMKSSPRP